MNELIPTTQNEQGEIILSGRELHEFLEVKTTYSTWFERMCEYGFAESIDYILLPNFEKQIGSGGHNKIDHHIRLDMAKEIAMIQRSDKGKQARQYFLQLEKMWNSPEMVMKRALEYANKKLEDYKTKNLVLEQRVSELQPKATYYDLVLQNKSLLSIGKIAKDYGWSATKMNKKLNELGVQYKQSGIWLIYQKYADKGFTQSTTHVIDDEKSNLHTKWTQKGRLFIYDLLKKEGIYPIIERELQLERKI